MIYLTIILIRISYDSYIGVLNVLIMTIEVYRTHQPWIDEEMKSMIVSRFLTPHDYFR